MKLKKEDYLMAKNFTDEIIKLDNEKIESHTHFFIKSFIENKDTSDNYIKNKIFLFLKHISSIFFNYYINNEIYFLSKNEIENCYKTDKLIIKIYKNFKFTDYEVENI